MAERPKEQQAAQTGRRGGTNHALDRNGKVIPEKLQENQRRLNVGSDHKTPDMKKGRRGTFP